jgi:osomolarity two-component system, sensor histidine kinase SLN1
MSLKVCYYLSLACLLGLPDLSQHIDGMQAVQLVKDATRDRKDYDLIFMDVQMPNMDGLEATRLIRQTGFKRPIVALSAYSDDTNVRSCHDSGMDDFVSKPIQIARLRLVLKTFCPNEEQSSSPGPTPGPSKERSSTRPMSSTSVVRSASNPSSMRKDAAAQKGDRPSPENEDVSPLSSPPLPPS